MCSRVGVYGDPVAVTPNLDALAGEGVRYSRVFTTAGVCAPSRAAHILGMHQIATGSQHMRTSTRPAGAYRAVPPPYAKAYPELLRAAGYYTFTDTKLDYQFSGPLAGSGPPTIWDAEGDMEADWRGRADGQPFFGFRNFLVTHESGIFRPLGSMPHSFRHFVLQLYRWWLLDGPVPEVVSPARVVVPPYYPDTPTVRADMARHYNNIAYMDREVGEILAQLRADHNVADDPAYHSDLRRLREALGSWQTRVPDWSDEAEAELVARFQPDGKQPATPPPVISVNGDRVAITPQAALHSIEYRLDEGRWRMYTGPIPVQAGAALEARAVRYGWNTSEMVRLVK